MAAEPAAPNPSPLGASGYMVPSVDRYSYGSDDEVASLPSESTSSSDLDALSDDYSDAEEEWRESIEQLELLLSMVLVPFVGKYLGRKCAYWSMSSVSCGHHNRKGTNRLLAAGWTRFMQWKYPVEVVVNNQASFKGTGAMAAL